MTIIVYVRAPSVTLRPSRHLSVCPFLWNIISTARPRARLGRKEDVSTSIYLYVTRVRSNGLSIVRKISYMYLKIYHTIYKQTNSNLTPPPLPQNPVVLSKVQITRRISVIPTGSSAKKCSTFRKKTRFRFWRWNSTSENRKTKIVPTKEWKSGKCRITENGGVPENSAKGTHHQFRQLR